MQTSNFKSERYFTLFDFNISHGQLLLRSQKNETHKRNIDIVFTGVKYISSFIYFNGIDITKHKTVSGMEFNSSLQKYLSYEDNFIFKLLSNSEEYLFAASICRIFQNELDFNQSSLEILNGQEDEIWSSIF